ncbi:sensor histidine kinase [Micromonospora sp. C28SCA-DRY-2]|uniref:sensor histidine kinase n=1 Tax=Micromonospora sp. C28SCA-DRY-2 TaxID=3059522 RepID=UPI002676908A|nr:sensor histidine kinase [Micromonospora sp. C28SCA-DRY-2]MDO3703300.1 sensor histidine kinase [Micromonospora sp. C28SCA-DRY-2]
MRMERITDLVLAAVTVVALLAGTALAGEPVGYSATVPLAVALGLAVLLRRCRPVGLLIVSAALIVAMRTSGLTHTGWIWPAAVAYFAAAAADRPGRTGQAGVGWAAGVGLTVLAIAANWEITVQGRDPQAVLGALGAELLSLIAIVSAGVAYRNQRRWRAQLAESTRALALQRTAEERLQIARELHDVVAHTLTVVGLQLRVAMEAVDDSPGEVRTALQAAQQVRSEAMSDLRALIAVLRDGAAGSELAPSSGLEGLAPLIGQVRAGGLHVAYRAEGDVNTVPAPVARAVYRVVQESLTNAIRHAGASAATVSLSCSDGWVTAEISDNGTGPTGDSVAGAGLRGMRERVTTLGGTFAAGQAGPHGGYTVRAKIPVPDSRP